MYCIITIMRVGVKTLFSKGSGQIHLGCLPFAGKNWLGWSLNFHWISANQAKKIVLAMVVIVFSFIDGSLENGERERRTSSVGPQFGNRSSRIFLFHLTFNLQNFQLNGKDSCTHTRNIHFKFISKWFSNKSWLTSPVYEVSLFY